MMIDSNLKSKLKRCSRYHTNVELKTMKQKNELCDIDLIKTKARQSRPNHTINVRQSKTETKKILKRMSKPEPDLTGQMQAIQSLLH